MGWNRPVEEKSGEANSCSLQKRSGDRFPKRRFPIRGAIAGAVVVVGAAVVAWWIFGGEPAPVREGADGTVQRRIKEVKPAIGKAAKEEIDYASLSNWDMRHLPPSETNHLSAAQIREWKMYHPWPPPDKNQPQKQTAKWKIFENHVDNEIAAIIAEEPGTMFFGDGSIYDGFDKRFRASLKRPIIVRESDSDYDKNLKRAVIEIKADLKARSDAGEDLSKVMVDARDELQRLGRYRAEIEELAVKELSKKDTTAADAEVMLESVNKMLEAKGMAPITDSMTSRVALRLYTLKKKEEQKNENH